MAATYTMGIDIGGGGVRCLVVDTASAALASASRPWAFPAIEHPSGLAYDVDLDETWRLVGEASREAIEVAGIAGDRVGSVAVSAIRFGVVIIGKRGDGIFAVPNRDARATVEGAEIAAACGDAINRETGSWPTGIHLPARLTMLMRSQPEIIADADCVFSLGDWVNYKLCGAKVTDFSQAGTTQLFDLTARKWNIDRIGALGITPDIFPEVRAAGSRIGTVGPEAAAHLGLTTAAIVGLGGGDTQCSLLGAGAIAPGQVACVAGTTTPVVAVTDRPVIDAAGRTWSGHHVVPGLWVLESSGGAMGETLTFMARLLFPELADPELRLFAEASQSEYGARGMLSSIGAEVVNFRAPAMPAGQITLSHLTCAGDANPRAHLCRALVEGYACAVRANLDVLSEVTGDRFDDIVLTAGFSRSGVFAQILADIAGGKVMQAGEAMTSALGAAICAAVAEGKFSDMASAVNALVRNRAPITHSPASAQVAQKVYADWLAMRKANEGAATAQIAQHVLPFIKGSGTGQAEGTVPYVNGVRTLVTAAFDEPSLDRMRAYMDVDYASIRDTRRVLKGADLIAAMQGKEVLVTEADIVDADAIAELPELRVVVACRGNAVNVDVEACSAFGIPVLFTPGRNSVAVADMTIAFMLALARKLVPAAQFLKEETTTAGNMAAMGQAYVRLQGHELWRKTIGLVGLGAVGRMVAKRLQGFDARVIAADPFANPLDAARIGVELVDLDLLLRESDFISMHAAVTPATANMIGAAELHKVKKGVYFINTARAQLVDEEALLAALQDGTLAGAALDTFLEEPPGFDHPLVAHPNVLSAPHVAGNTHEIAAHQGADVSAALLAMLRGEQPQACLNPDILRDFSWSKARRRPSQAELETLRARPAPGVSDLERDRNAGVKHRGLKEVQQSAPPASASREIVERMQRLFGAFCASIARDEAVKAFARTKSVTLGFNAPDVDLKFFIALDNGSVAAEVGERKGDVQIAMRGFVLDGLFNGTTDATDAVMKGEISLMGNAAQAMTLQDLQADLARLYKAARAGAGDLGELASLGKKANAVPATAAQRDQRHELLDTVNELYEYHIITATGGNVSVRCDDNPGECWITPSAVFKGDLSPDLMVRITLDGEKVDPLSPSPSSEWGFHTKTLKKKPRANAVIHAHAPNATILVNSGIPFLPISSEAAFFGEITRIPFVMPGSDDLAERISEAMRTDWAVLMENHGIVVAGKSLRRASDMAQIIERTAEVILGCYQATGGRAPKVLPQEAIDLFRSMGDVVA